jgi:hypothetical protein
MPFYKTLPATCRLFPNSIRVQTPLSHNRSHADDGCQGSTSLGSMARGPKPSRVAFSTPMVEGHDWCLTCLRLVLIMYVGVLAGFACRAFGR